MGRRAAGVHALGQGGQRRPRDRPSRRRARRRGAAVLRAGVPAALVQHVGLGRGDGHAARHRLRRRSVRLDERRHRTLLGHRRDQHRVRPRRLSHRRQRTDGEGVRGFRFRLVSGHARVLRPAVGRAAGPVRLRRIDQGRRPADRDEHPGGVPHHAERQRERRGRRRPIRSSSTSRSRGSCPRPCRRPTARRTTPTGRSTWTTCSAASSITPPKPPTPPPRPTAAPPRRRPRRPRRHHRRRPRPAKPKPTIGWLPPGGFDSRLRSGSPNWICPVVAALVARPRRHWRLRRVVAARHVACAAAARRRGHAAEQPRHAPAQSGRRPDHRLQQSQPGDASPAPAPACPAPTATRSAT